MRGVAAGGPVPQNPTWSFSKVRKSIACRCQSLFDSLDTCPRQTGLASTIRCRRRERRGWKGSPAQRFPDGEVSYWNSLSGDLPRASLRRGIQINSFGCSHDRSWHHGKGGGSILPDLLDDMTPLFSQGPDYWLASLRTQESNPPKKQHLSLY